MPKTKTQLTGRTPGAVIAVTCNDELVFDGEIPQLGTTTEEAVLAEWLVTDATEWTTHERGYDLPLKGTPVQIALTVQSGTVWFCTVRNQVLQPLYSFENVPWRQDVFVPDSDTVALSDLRYRDDDRYQARYGLTKNEVLPCIVMIENADQHLEWAPDVNITDLRHADGSVAELADGWICVGPRYTLTMHAVLNPVDPWQLVLPG